MISRGRWKGWSGACFVALEGDSSSDGSLPCISWKGWRGAGFLPPEGNGRKMVEGPATHTAGRAIPYCLLPLLLLLLYLLLDSVVWRQGPCWFILGVCLMTDTEAATAVTATAAVDAAARDFVIEVQHLPQGVQHEC